MKEKPQRKSMIKVRGGYSDKNGYEVVCNSLQTDDFDDRTRTIISNEIFNIFKYIFRDEMSRYQPNYRAKSNDLCTQILSQVFNKSTAKRDIDTLYLWETIFYDIEDVIKNAVTNEVLDMIWFIFNWISDNFKKDLTSNVKKHLNYVFERECVGYRLIDGDIARITDDLEIGTINTACSCKYSGCKTHIKKALAFLSDRTNPDYKNSIKESISAVESICQIITDDENATLGQALKHLESKGIAIHKALEKAFSSLYGYASNEGGIRHAEGMFESNVTFEEAKYMLVSCCAFVNYLIGEFSKLNK